MSTITSISGLALTSPKNEDSHQEVPVRFIAHEEISAIEGEEEVVFEEEVKTDTPNFISAMPELHFQPFLIGLPLLLLIVFIWNVCWKKKNSF